MRWHCVESESVTILRSCTAPDRAAALAILRPVEGVHFVTSDASWRVGGFRRIGPPQPSGWRGGAGRTRSDAVKARLSAAMKAVHARKRGRRST